MGGRASEIFGPWLGLAWAPVVVEPPAGVPCQTVDDKETAAAHTAKPPGLNRSGFAFVPHRAVNLRRHRRGVEPTLLYLQLCAGISRPDQLSIRLVQQREN